MPPSGKLPEAEIDILDRWVKDGLPWPDDGRKPTSRKMFKAAPSPRPPAGPASWAYHAGHPALGPPVKNRDWVRNPIDAFILARLEAKGLTGRAGRPGRADPPGHYDLTGLPPTPEEVDSFRRRPLVHDAYERLVDRLLASPHYGENWGRHWLDLVRYAETNGYERDGRQALAWRYRDYVITPSTTTSPTTGSSTSSSPATR